MTEELEEPSDLTPPPVEAAPVDVRDANSQFINLAPENQPRDPNRSKAEVSEEARFRTISPERARTLIGEKISHPVPQKHLFEDVEPHDQSYRGEHQRASGYAQSRRGRTEQGTEVIVRRGEFSSYSVESEPSYREELAVHEDGIEIHVEYGEPGKDQRALVWFMPRRTRGANEISIQPGPQDTPEHITIYDATKEDALTITPWNPETRSRDRRFDRAIQEMGILLGGRITWDAPNTPASELPAPPDPRSEVGDITAFENSVRSDLSKLPETPPEAPNN